MSLKSQMLMMAYAFAAMGQVVPTMPDENKSYPKELKKQNIKEPLTKIGEGKTKFTFNDEKFGEIVVMADNQK